jgi:hypothetical protein
VRVAPVLSVVNTLAPIQAATNNSATSAAAAVPSKP